MERRASSWAVFHLIDHLPVFSTPYMKRPDCIPYYGRTAGYAATYPAYPVGPPLGGGNRDQMQSLEKCWPSWRENNSFRTREVASCGTKKSRPARHLSQEKQDGDEEGERRGGCIVSTFSFISRFFFFKIKYLENRKPNLWSVFTFEILVSRSSKLDRILIGFKILFSILLILLWLYSCVLTDKYFCF
jgi:hypothetical protein